MTIQNLYPNIDPTLLLDFANVKALDPRITFARASAATYYGTETAKAEENLLLQSQFASGWLNNGTNTITANNATAPDGTTTAALVSSLDQFDYVYQAVTFVIGQVYTASFFVKNTTGANAATVSLLFIRSTANNASISINWSGSTLSSVTLNDGTAADFVSVGSDWYRVRVTFTAAETAPRFRIYGGNFFATTGDILVWGAQLEARSAVTAYTPTTTQPITNFVPVLESAAAGEARFDHNPVTGESLGLLIEESRTNLLLRSEEFDDAGWTKVAGTVTANTIVAPDGTLTGDKFIANTVSGQHRLDQTPVSSAGAQTFSVYAKAGGYNFVGLRVGSSGSSFNLSTEAVSVDSAGSVGSIQSVGNGWYRCSIVVAAASANDIARINITEASSPSVSFVGDGFSGIFIWGAQLEEGAFATSYVATTTAQVTRAADAASMTGANFSSWYRQDEGSFYSEVLFGASAAVQGETSVLNVLQDNSLDNQVRINRLDNGILRLRYRANASDVGSPSVASAMPLNKVAAAYANGSQAIAANGTLGNIGSGTGAIPTVNNIVFGRLALNQPVVMLNGHIRKISYYPKRIANDQLQGLTT